MRTRHTPQTSIFDQFAQHEIGCELAAMPVWLGARPDVLDGVAKNLRESSVNTTELYATCPPRIDRKNALVHFAGYGRFSTRRYHARSRTMIAHLSATDTAEPVSP